MRLLDTLHRRRGATAATTASSASALAPAACAIE